MELFLQPSDDSDFLGTAGHSDFVDVDVAFPYPSAYQPPPFKWKELVEISLCSEPSHLGQAVNGSSVMLCQDSVIFWHASHSYS